MAHSNGHGDRGSYGISAITNGGDATRSCATRCTDESWCRERAVARLAPQKAGVARSPDRGWTDLCGQDICGVAARTLHRILGWPCRSTMGVSDRFHCIATGQRTRSCQELLSYPRHHRRALVSIALVFGLAQYGELFVAALALWILFCNFLARAVRNFASYGFQLGGYTVAIIGIPAALNPAGAYTLVVARFTEILLGIICAALVSRLFLVRELSPQLIELVRALARRADSFVTSLLAPDADCERVSTERIKLTKAYLDIQAMQDSTYFESAEARVLDQPLRRLTQATVEVCAAAEAAASERQVGFRSLVDTWADTTTPHGRLMLTVLGGLAEFERELIRARTSEGRKRATERGVHMGRPQKLTPHQRREALARRDAGEALVDIARSYNVSHPTISRLR